MTIAVIISFIIFVALGSLACVLGCLESSCWAKVLNVSEIKKNKILKAAKEAVEAAKCQHDFEEIPREGGWTVMQCRKCEARFWEKVVET